MKIKRLILAIMLIVLVTSMEEVAEASVTGNRDWKWPVPVSNTISSCYLDGRAHYAIDISAGKGNSIYASYSGTVISTYKGCTENYAKSGSSSCPCGKCGDLGNSVYILHSYNGVNYVSRYGHMTNVYVNVGDFVTKDTVIGTIGTTGSSSGNHLDFRIYQGNSTTHTATSCIDPFKNQFLEMPSGLNANAADTSCCYTYVDEVKELYSTQTDTAPTGYLDEASGGTNSIYVKGWAYDPDATGTALMIHIYVDDTRVAICKADKIRTDVNAKFGCGDYHGYETTFEYKVPATGTHTVKAYALNTDTTGVNSILTGSPKTVTVTADKSIVVTNESAPVTLNSGAGFDMKGAVQSSTNLTKIVAGVYDCDGNMLTGNSATPNTTSYEIANLDDGVHFNQLSPGVYYYRVTATNTGETVTLIDQVFIVLADSATIDDGVYMLQAREDSSYVIGVEGDSDISGANMQLEIKADDPYQKFQFTHIGNGYYTLDNCGSGSRLDVEGEGSTKGTNVWQWEKLDNTAQKWQVLPVGDSYCLVPQCATNLCLDIKDNKMAEGTNIRIWEPNLDNAERFMLVSCDIKTYTITYHLDGGINASTNPDSYTSDIISLTLDDPTKDGYVFLGWYTASDGGEKFTSDSACEGDLELYARWEALAPDLKAPENIVLSPVNSERLSVSWDMVDGATGYMVYAAEKEDGEYVWKASCTSETATIKGLELGKEYFVKVKAKYEKDDVKIISEYSEATCGYVAPAAPSSVSVKAVDHTSATVNWKEVTGATGYHVYISEEEIDGFELAAETEGNDAVSATLEGLETGKKYYAKVRAVYKDAEISAESLDSKVKNVLIPPAVPNGLVVVSQAGNAAKVSWEASTGATGYAVYMAEESSGPYVWKNATSGNDATSIVIYNLETGKKYYFVVCAKYENGTVKVLSKYTTAKSVRIAPDVPQKVTLTTDSYESVKVSWKAATGATGYAVYMADSENGTYSWKKALAGNGETSTVIYGLETGKTYYFKVLSKYECDDLKILSEYSSPVDIKVIPKEPSNFKVISETMDSVTASWKEVSGATGYEVYMSDSKDGTYTLSAVTEGNDFVTATISGLTTAQKYYFKVLAKYESGDVDVDSEFSSAKTTVVLPGVPQGVTAANDNTTTVVVNWEEVTGATGYVVYMSDSKDGTYEWKSSVSSSGKLRAYIKGLTIGETYYFKVRAKTEIDGVKALGDYSEAIAILAAPAIPGSFKVSAKDYETATVSWNKVADCTGYAVYQSDKADSGFVRVQTLSGNAVTSVDVTGLESKKRYYFKVHALCETDETTVESRDSAVKSVVIPEFVPEITIIAGSTGGNTTVLTAVTNPTGSSVAWSSSNTAVATVSDGVVTSKTEGTAVISAKMTYEGVEYTDSCTVEIGKNVTYGSWSSYSINEAYTSETQEVRTTVMYRYYCFLCPVCGGREPFIGTSDCGNYTLGQSNSVEIWSTIPYSQSNYGSYSYTATKLYTTSLGDGLLWNFSAGNLNSTAVGTQDSDSEAIVIRTGYSTRSMQTNYYINRIS